MGDSAGITRMPFSVGVGRSVEWDVSRQMRGRSAAWRVCDDEGDHAVLETRGGLLQCKSLPSQGYL